MPGSLHGFYKPGCTNILKLLARWPQGEKIPETPVGLKEWNEFKPSEIVRKYRQFVYETGAVDAGKGKTIDENVVEKARKRKYKISRVDRFRYRCRYSPG